MSRTDEAYELINEGLDAIGVVCGVVVICIALPLIALGWIVRHAKDVVDR